MTPAPVTTTRATYTDKIAAYEAELLRMFPKGKATAMRAVLASPPAVLHRYKYVCKRLEVLRKGLDIEVDVWVSPVNPKRCFARRVAEPPAERAPSTEPEPSATDLAFELHVPIETVEIALARRPASLDPRHLREWVLTVHDTVKSAAATAPPGPPRRGKSPPPASKEQRNAPPALAPDNS